MQISSIVSTPLGLNENKLCFEYSRHIKTSLYLIVTALFYLKKCNKHLNSYCSIVDFLRC